MTVKEEEIAEIKRRVSIVDVIGQAVKLTKRGKNYIGLCPFHGEKTPSFSVNAEKGFYHCFGCGKSGDVIRFIEDYRNVDFQSALKEVAELAGISISLDNERERVADNPNRVLFDINNEAAHFYNVILTSTSLGQMARDYLSARGIDDDLIKTYQIGLAADDEDLLYQSLSAKYDEQVLVDSGLFSFGKQKVYDTFQNRLMFPIRNQYGQTVGFSGRVWQSGDDRQGKYVNTAATKIFDKSFELYNLDRAKAIILKTHEVYLMEGFMDVIAAHKSGIDNVVASMGTALTEQHVNRLSRLAKKFILAYDGDGAGQHAIEKALALMPKLDASIIKVPDALDPDEYEKKQGPEALKQLLTTARMSRSEFLMEAWRPENLSAVESQLKFLQDLAPIIANETSLQAQDVYVRRLVEILPDFEYNQVEDFVNNFRETARGTRKNSQLVSQGTRQVAPEIASLPKVSASERVEQQILARMIARPDFLEKMSFESDFRFIHANYAALYEQLIAEDLITSGQIDPLTFADKLDDNLKNYFYQIMSLNLPDKVTDEELSDLTESLKKAQLAQKITEINAQLLQAKKAGNAQLESRLVLQLIDLQKEKQQSRK